MLRTGVDPQIVLDQTHDHLEIVGGTSKIFIGTIRKKTDSSENEEKGEKINGQYCISFSRVKEIQYRREVNKILEEKSTSRELIYNKDL